MIKNKKGFTLIELLLILTIIGLIIAIIFINFATAKHRAKYGAVLRQVSTAQNAIEVCNAQKRVLFCAGLEDDRITSTNCTGDSTITGQPVSGTAICGSSGRTASWSNHTWPSIESNGYMYGTYAGSNIQEGKYAFSVFLDSDSDGIPDNTNGVCCTNEGCNAFTETILQKGQKCYKNAEINTED